MAEFKQFTYTNNGTEIDFMQGFIELLQSLDNNIAIQDKDGNPTTVADQYADLTSASRAQFLIDFGNGNKLNMTRQYANNSGAREFTGTAQIRYTNSNYTAMTQGARSFFVAYLKNENILMLWLGWYNVENISGASISVIVLNNNNVRFTALGTSTNPLGYNLVGNNTTITYSPVFAYSAGAGNIDFVEKAVFVSGGSKAFETEEIKSCSTIPQFTSIALPDGRNFFTVATNAMIEIDSTT